MKPLLLLILSTISICTYAQKSRSVEITKINNIGEDLYAVVEFNTNVFLRVGYVFNVLDENGKVGKLEIDSVGLDRAYGFIFLKPELNDHDKLIKNHELLLFKSYFIKLAYIYELSLNENRDKFHQLSFGLDYYPSFSTYKKLDDIWIGGNVGYLFGTLYDPLSDNQYNDLTHLFVRIELGHSPFYRTKTKRGPYYGISFRPHTVKFYIDDYYSTTKPENPGAYIYLKNKANVFIGAQYSAIDFRFVVSLGSMEVDNTFAKDMNSIYFRIGINF